MTISGSWDDGFSGRDLANFRTVIKAPTTSQDCFKANGVSNRLDGVDLTGGRYGVWTTLKYKSGDNTKLHHLLSHCVISNNTTGIYDGGSSYAYGFACRSCLFTGNTTAIYGDDNTGGSAAFAKRTISAGLAALAPNGVCHVANGTYVGKISIAVAGATLAGESRDGVIVQAAEDGPADNRPDFALAIAADNVTVSNLTLTCAGAGVYVPDVVNVKSARIDSVVISGNHHGYWCYSGGDNNACRSTVYRNRLTHCVSRDNSGYGAFFRFGTRIDNALFADNTWSGIYVSGWNGDGDAGWTQCGISLVHVTSVGNAYGYCQETANYSSYQYFANCIFAGNTTAGVHASNNARLYSCDFWNNGTDVEAANSTPTLYDARYVDPLVDATAKLRGHLLAGSPCAQSGTNLVTTITTMPEAFSNDLDHAERLLDKVDLGCYVSPETISETGGGESRRSPVRRASAPDFPSPGIRCSIPTAICTVRRGTDASISAASGGRRPHRKPPKCMFRRTVMTAIPARPPPRRCVRRNSRSAAWRPAAFCISPPVSIPDRSRLLWKEFRWSEPEPERPCFKARRARRRTTGHSWRCRSRRTM